MSLKDQILESLGRIVTDVVKAQQRRLERRSKPTRRRPTGGSPGTSSSGRTPPPLSPRYPGDYRGAPPMTYDPHPGKLPDPGEVVWTWVPFEEDHEQGKDRPALVVGRDGDWLLALGLTSQDHDLDKAQEAAAGRYWVEIGSGPWDAQGRISEVRINRVIRVDPTRVRRVSGRLERVRFEKVAAAVRRRAR